MSAATLHYTPALHTTLRAIATGRVVQSRWHDGEYQWADGGHMPQDMQDQIATLLANHVAVLSQIGFSCLRKSVDTNNDGDQLLATWELAARVAS
jgi:hypothetical protein